MSRIRKVYHIARADLLERTRGYGFLVTLFLSIIGAFLFVPNSQATYAVLLIDQYRGVLNSAWIGAAVSISVMSFLTMFGFFLIKNTIERDRQTRVGQIISTTTLRKLDYMAGKFLSNFAILTIIVILTFTMAIVMQLLRQEDLTIDLGSFVLPMVIIILPGMFALSALAVLFETLPVLRTGFGNILFFFCIWAPTVLISIPTFDIFGLPVSSFTGREIFKDSISESYKHLFPQAPGVLSDGVVLVEEPLQTFLWSGVNWSWDIFISRIFWIIIAIPLLLLAAVAFRGFDKPIRKSGKWQLGFFSRKEVSSDTENDKNKWVESSNRRAAALSKVTMRFHAWDMLKVELKLMLKGQPLWWYAIAFLFIVLTLFAPLPLAKGIIAPLAWLWPVLLWSNMGVREIRYNTRDIIFSSPAPLQRQIPVSWLAGLIVAVLTGSGLAVRYMVEGDASGLLAWGIGALFIPSLALAMGVWTRSNKAFEAFYLLIMFTGTLNKEMWMDFMGVVDGTIEAGVPYVFLMVTVGLLVLVVWGRGRQVRR
ncbi:MAG TPA: ABC transporter permease [Brevibacillus sp.]|nr:ABC transporter permease [Brevibacillus sp.]